MASSSASPRRLAWVLVVGLAAHTLADTFGAGPAATLVEIQGSENAFKLTGKVYSGSQPEGEVAFAALQKLGVKTIISVDGAQPDAAAAARHGLRYVHLPFGYDGVAASNALLIARAVEVSPGPVFVHCHHGKHRGPAAAALACIGVEGWTPEQGLDFLRLAGTATNYSGLYRSVREFRAPTRAELQKLPAEFPAQVRVSDLAAAMVAIDHHFDALKAIQKAGFRPPPDQPDLSPANTALMLWEAVRETQRLEDTRKRGAAFMAELDRSERAARTLHERLKAGALKEAEAAFQTASRSCSACHKAHRD